MMCSVASLLARWDCRAEMSEAEDITAMVDLPLRDLRIVEVTRGRGDTCGRVLADLGADVVSVRPLALEGEDSNGLDSLRFRVRNANKRVLTLSFGEALQGEGFRQLVERADILISTLDPRELEAHGILPDEIRRLNPRIVFTSITNFGCSGPYRDWLATDPVIMALNSELSRSGLPDHPPLIPPGSLAEETASVQAAWSTLVALWKTRRTGQGECVDASIFDSSMQTMDPPFGIAGSARVGLTASDLPAGRPDARHLYPIFQCADGYVRICVLAVRQWRGMFKWLGEPKEFEDPKYEHLQTRQAAAPSLHPLIGRLFSGKTRAEIVREGQGYGVPTEAVQTASEVLATPHFLERGALVPIQLADGRTGIVPNGCLEVGTQRAGIRHGPLSVALDSVLDEWRGSAPSVTFGHDDLEDVQRRPLSDLVVLDLGVIVVGAETSRLFADFGADVIKVENRDFPDGNRQTIEGATMSMSFAMGHRNKHGLGLNLRCPEGRDLFQRLVGRADVVLSNFKPGTLESLGLGYRTLREINPNIVTVESSALGKSGPWSERMGYGPLVRAVTGLSQLWRYPDQPDGFCDGITVYPDHTASRLGAIAALACLMQRGRGSGGNTVAVAQSEVILSQFSEQFLRESIEPDTMIARGNVGEFDAPYGVFPCAGEDQWCVITVRDTRDWRNLCSVIGGESLADDAGLQSAAGRRAQRERIESLLSSWTSTRESREVMRTLQGAGVPVGAMNRVNDLPSDPQVVARSVFRTMHQPQIGDVYTGGSPARFSSIAEPELAPAPMYGEHTRAIARELLALGDGEIDALVAGGVLDEGNLPPDDRGSN